MKPQKMKVEGKDYFAWPYEEQTKIKHRVLSAYYKVYATKLGKNRDTMFFDCHGGSGVYIHEDKNITYGSLTLIYETVQEIFLNRTTNNYLIACEIEKDTYTNLCQVLKDKEISARVATYNDNYNNVLSNTKVVRAYNQFSTLFFIDPFGYYDTPMINLKPLMQPFGNEILINFMFDFLNRGIGVSSIDEQQLNAFFNCEDWKKAKQMSGTERESFLVGLYKTKLKEVTGANFVFAYRLCFPNKNQTYYYLIHATNHIDGISLMKGCFASINNGRVEYLGKRENQASLFDMDHYKQAELRALMINRFIGRTISFKGILENIIEDTGSLEKHVRAALKEMESKGEISVRRIDSVKTGIKGNDKITFEVSLK